MMTVMMMMMMMYLDARLNVLGPKHCACFCSLDIGLVVGCYAYYQFKMPYACGALPC